MIEDFSYIVPNKIVHHATLNIEGAFSKQMMTNKAFDLATLMSNTSNTNSKIVILITSLGVLFGAAMIANPIGMVNAQANQSQAKQSQGNKADTT